MSEITCSTQVPVQQMMWFSGGAEMIMEEMSTQELVLVLTITADHNNTDYMCVAIASNGFMASQNITIITTEGHKIDSLLPVVTVIMATPEDRTIARQTSSTTSESTFTGNGNEGSYGLVIGIVVVVILAVLVMAMMSLAIVLLRLKRFLMNTLCSIL